MKGWSKLAPPEQRLPLPRTAAFALAADLSARGFPQMGVAVMLSFVCYLRPGECQTLWSHHLVRPRPEAGERYASWGVLLHDASMGRIGKTGMQDEAVLIDLDPWLFPALASLVGRPSAPRPLWSHTAEELRVQFRASCLNLQLGRLGASLYCLRHGGASDDLLTKRRTLAEVRERGRWRTDASVRRYGKTTRLQSEIHKVPPATWQLGQQAEAHFAQALLGQLLPHSKPLRKRPAAA